MFDDEALEGGLIQPVRKQLSLHQRMILWVTAIAIAGGGPFFLAVRQVEAASLRHTAAADTEIPEATQSQLDSATTALQAVLEYDEEAAALAPEPSTEAAASTESGDGPPEYDVTPLDVRLESMITPLLGETTTVDMEGYRVDITSNAAGTVDIVGNNTGDSEREVIVIKDATAPTEYEFKIDPADPSEADGLEIVPNPDGSGAYQIVDSAGELAADIAAPWARTANGTPVATSYSVVSDPETGSDILVQTVDHTGLSASDYPVVADPDVTFTCGVTTCTIYFSVAFSSHFNHLLTYYGPGGAALITAAACAPIGGVGAAVCGSVVLLRYGDLKYFANQAASEGRCLGIKFLKLTPATVWFQTNGISNKNCHAK